MKIHQKELELKMILLTCTTPTQTRASSESMDDFVSLKMLIMWITRLVYSPHWLITKRTPMHRKGCPKAGDAIRLNEDFQPESHLDLESFSSFCFSISPNSVVMS